MQFPKHQVPKAVRSEAPCNEFRAKRLEQARGPSAASRKSPLGKLREGKGIWEIAQALIFVSASCVKMVYCIKHRTDECYAGDIATRELRKWALTEDINVKTYNIKFYETDLTLIR